MFKAGDRVRRIKDGPVPMTKGTEWIVEGGASYCRETIYLKGSSGGWRAANFELIEQELPFPLLVRLSNTETRVVRSAADFPPTPFTVLETYYKEPEFIVGRKYRHISLSQKVTYEFRGVVDELPVFKTQQGNLFIENASTWRQQYKLIEE